MHKRASSLRRMKEAEKEVRVEEKEVTSVEDVEPVVREETRGDPNFLKFMEQMNENFKQMNKKFDKNREETNQNITSFKGDFEKMEEKIDNNNKTMEEKVDSNNKKMEKNMET